MGDNVILRESSKKLVVLNTVERLNRKFENFLEVFAIEIFYEAFLRDGLSLPSGSDFG